jgi:hypothetical protein
MLEYIVVWIKRVYKRIREPSDHVLVIRAIRDRIGIIEELRIFGSVINVSGANYVLIS